MNEPQKQIQGTGLETNEGTWDRVFRISVGIGLLCLVVFNPQMKWGLLGIIPFVTGLFGFCPLYAFFGFSTCPHKKR